VNRRHLRVVVALVTILSIGAVVTTFIRSAKIGDVWDLAVLTADNLPELLQRIRNFHRVVTRDGQKLLEVSAEEAAYYKNQKAVIIQRPRVVFFDKGVELDGDVILQLEQFRIQASNLAYDHTSEEVRVRGKMELTSPEMELSGTDLVIDMVERRLTMQEDVRMVVRGASS
jgi:lipopolysaccharide export system protein LptC